MSAPHADDDAWLYHLPAFVDGVRDRGAHQITDEVELDLGGVLYHHRGARMPAYEATFLWRGDTFELELDAVGRRKAWAIFDAERSWDFFLFRAADDQPCLAWMTDGEFREEEADEFDGKQEAIGLGRFSFGLYLHAPGTWETVEERARSADAPLFVHRPSGRMLVPEENDLGEISEVLPAELRPDDETPPAYLGVVDAHVDAGGSESR